MHVAKPFLGLDSENVSQDKEVETPQPESHPLMLPIGGFSNARTPSLAQITYTAAVALAAVDFGCSNPDCHPAMECCVGLPLRHPSVVAHRAGILGLG